MVGDEGGGEGGGGSVAYSGINVNIILLWNNTKKVCEKLRQTKRNPYFQAVSSDWFDFSWLHEKFTLFTILYKNKLYKEFKHGKK